MSFRILVTACIALVFVSCAKKDPKPEADTFLKSYTRDFQKLYYEANKAQWLANTDISDAHDSLSTAASKTLAKFMGSKKVIEKTKTLLDQKDKLDPLCH